MSGKLPPTLKGRALGEAILWEGLRNRLAVNAKDGSLMVYVPAGEFEMGDGEDTDCPKHWVALSAYWIGVYCVSNAQYLAFVEATRHRAPDNTTHREPGKAAHPVTDVSWDDARAYAQWAGCGLPTEAQWEKAARGPGGLIYPWGNDWDAGRCRHNQNKGNETTCAVHGYPRGVSGYGTYNQSGNVWESCADWYGPDYYGQFPARDPVGPSGGSFRGLRGGSFWDVAPALLRAAFRRWDVPGRRYVPLGFRLVRTLSGPLPS